MSKVLSISRSQYLQLVGLMTLAQTHNRALEDIEKAAKAITGEADVGSHTGDVVYGSRNGSADELLKVLGITVYEE